MLNLDRLHRPERFGPWLAGIGLNICRRWLRQRSRERWSVEARQGGQRWPEAVDLASDPAALVEEADIRQRLLAAVAFLPRGQRGAVALVYLAGLTQRDAATELGITEGAVKTRLFKARSAMRSRLDESSGQEQGVEIVHDTGDRPAMIEVQVADVVRPTGESGHRHYGVVLREVGGGRLLSIWIGEFEAMAMALYLVGAEQPRPQTYAFAANALLAGGGRVREVRILRLVDDVYYAEAVIAGPSGTTLVDARPSDAINIALVVAAPIRIAAEILTAHAVTSEDLAANNVGSGAAAIAAAVLARETT